MRQNLFLGNFRGFMKRLLIQIAFLIFLVNYYCNAQEYTWDEEGIEVYLIDAYVKQEIPHQFVLSFFTSDSCFSRVMIDGQYEYLVSETLSDEHKTEIELTGLKFDSVTVPFEIYVKANNGKEYVSENYELLLPFKNEIDFNNSPGLFEVCCFGGIIFGIPSPTFISRDGNNHFGLTKEIPLISYYAVGYNYPAGYLSIEYEYIFNADIKHFLRFGYKHIFQLPVIEYVSPGAGAMSNLVGFNGVSAEISIGIVKIYNVFTLFTKYRYNIQPGNSNNDFHELSIGLYSNFFSLNL